MYCIPLKQVGPCLQMSVRDRSAVSCRLILPASRLRRLDDACVPPRHRLRSPDAHSCQPSATTLFHSPVLVSGTVCYGTSRLHLLCQFCAGAWSLISSDAVSTDRLYCCSPHAVTRSHFGHFNRSYYYYFKPSVSRIPMGLEKIRRKLSEWPLLRAVLNTYYSYFY